MPRRSLNEITTVIASNMEKELDTAFKFQLAVRVDYWRSTLVGRSLEKHPEQRDFFKQTLWMPMAPGDKVPCPLPFQLCSQGVSKYPIPAPIRGNTLFDFVGSIDGKQAFLKISAGTAAALTAGKYSKNLISYDYQNEYIILPENPEIPMIRIDDVFDQPSEVYAFNCKNAGQCSGWDEPYPVTGDMVQAIVECILKVDYNKIQNSITKNSEIEVNP